MASIVVGVAAAPALALRVFDGIRIQILVLSERLGPAPSAGIEHFLVLGQLTGELRLLGLLALHVLNLVGEVAP